MTPAELSVVCRSCGSEVSPYVTECPYCGARVRKRAPKLERHGDELQARETRRNKLRRARAERFSGAERPYAVLAAVTGAVLAVLVQRAADLPVSDLGAIVGPVDGEWWRYLAAPFVYPDVGYMFVTSVAIVIFGVGVERRLGTVATLVLMVACGALGMLAADGVEGLLAGEGELLLAAGGNGVALGLLAAWAAMRRRELREQPDDDVDIIGVAVIAVVLIMLPLVEDFANVFAGLAGALVGGACGLAAAYARRERLDRDPDDPDDLAA